MVSTRVAIQFRSGASLGSDTIAHTVSASWTTPIATACQIGARRAIHAVTYPPAAMHALV